MASTRGDMPNLVEVIDDGAVRTLRLNRPDRLNALGNAMRDALDSAVRSTEDHECRVVVLEGAGRAFSAGADLKADSDRAVSAGSADPPSQPRTWRRRRRDGGAWQRLLDRLEALPQVTVASVHGYCIGGAFLLASACDLRVAERETAFAIPEVALGIPLTWAGIPRLYREIGISRTRELILTGRRITADEARDWGFVHRVGDRLAETEALVDELLAMPEAPLLISKDALRAHGRTVASMEAAWADPDIIHWAGREPESRDAAQSYAQRTVRRQRK